LGDKITVQQVLAELPFRGGCYHNPITNGYYKLGDFDPNAPDFKAGQMILPTDISAIRSEVILQETLNIARPNYLMRNACRVVPSMTLAFKVRRGTALTASEKVPVLEEAKIATVGVDYIPYELWKNVVLVVVPIESRYQTGANILSLDIEDSGKALAAAENKQIKEVAEAAEEVEGHDWGDSNNPYVDVAAAMEEMKPYSIDFMAANPLVWMNFFGNDKVKGANMGVQTPEGLMGGLFQIPGLPGVKGISDPGLTDTLALIGSTKAPGILHADGPSESARFSNELAGYDAFIVRHWIQPQIDVSNAIRQVTGVRA
jgi:hypothetical protein